jgi:hypothetical protein
MQKNEKSLGRGEEALTEGALGPGTAKDTLGLFLLPAGRPGRRFTRADDEATKVSVEALFFPTARAAAAPLLHRGAKVQARSTCISHGGTSWEKKTLDEFELSKMVRRKS